MSNEEFEKKMEFILNQQAQFSAGLGELKDIVTQLARATLNRFEATDKRIDNVEEKIAALVDSQIRTAENLTRLEENLTNLTAVVDRYFSEGRNGKTEA